MRKIFLEGKYLVCRVEEQQRRKGKKIFHDGKWAVCGEEGKGGKYLEMENLSSECCKTLKFSMIVVNLYEKMTCGRPYLHFDWNIWPQATSLLRC